MVERSAIRAGAAHLKLARAVLAGELKSCAWDALKALYFNGSTDQACMDQLVAWADKHGIEVTPEEHRLEVAGRIIPAWRIHLKPK